MSEIVYLAGGNGGPAAPAALAAVSASPQKVALKWTASATPAPAGTATYYIVKRSATAGTGHKLVAHLLTGTTYTDATADPAATSYYVVTAVNTGGESVPSNEITVAPHPK
jgi:fibronectin type 3 domain-containing protein